MIDDPAHQLRAQQGINAVTTVLLTRWGKRWGVILAATLVFGLVEPQLMPIFYGALAFAAFMLLMVLGARRAITNRLSAGQPPIVEAEAREIEDDPAMIDVTPTERVDGREG